MSFKNKSSKKKSNVKSLDLHGYKVSDVFDAVELFISKNTHTRKVKIIPGKGSGAVKKEVLRYLKLAGYTSYCEILPNGSRNEGVLLVDMD